jgi:CheY-like chemotaxis protein
LPLAIDAEATPPADQPARKGAALKPGAKVLVVEDNPDARHILCEILDLAGYECHAVEDGEAALAAAESVRPDAAVIDIGLPVIDGFELARRLRSDPRCSSIFLIALTGYGRPVDRQHALRAGFDEHLVKPVDTHTLLSLLGNERADGALLF